MNQKIICRVALIVISLGIYACTDDILNPLPDLNPDTPEGGEILIYDINDRIDYIDEDFQEYPQQFDAIDRSYDLNGDSVIDLSFRSGAMDFFLGSPTTYNVQMRFVGEVLRTNYIFEISTFQDSPVFLPVSGLVSGTAEGRWTVAGAATAFMMEGRMEGVGGPWLQFPSFPVGLSYIPTRTNLNGQYYYGWIEIFASDFQDDVPEEFILISRYGLSQTPGLRIRMGQD